MRRLYLAAATAPLVLCMPAAAQAPTYSIDLPAQALDRSLYQVARVAKLQLVFADPAVTRVRAARLSGRFTASQMLTRLLAGTGYSFDAGLDGIVRVHAAEAKARKTSLQLSSPPQPTAVAENAHAAVEATAPEEDIVVTGSRIGGAKLAGSLPVTVLDQGQIAARGVVTTAELAATIPQMGGQGFNSANQGPNNARGDVASPNLRGLGAGNTLTLFNGRRLVANPGTQQEGSVPVQTVNLNTIPANSIGRVEVLRDGAGAIYGSDATAGVLNFITDTQFEGLELSGRYGGSGGTSLRETDLSARWGFRSTDGATRLTVAADAYFLADMPASERSYARTDNLRDRVPAQYASFFDNRSTLTPWTSGTVRTPIAGLGTTFTSFFVQPCTFSGSRAAIPSAAGVCLNGGSSSVPTALRYDEGPQRTLTPQTRRYSFASTFSHDFGSVELFAETLLYHAETSASRGGSTNLTTAPLLVGANNPYNPFGSGPGRLPGYTGPAQPITIVGLRVDDVGPRRIRVGSDTLRLLAGLRGSFGGWKWETAALYSWARTEDSESNRVSNAALQTALLSSDPGTAYNPFTGGNLADPAGLDPSFNPANVVDPLRITVRRNSETQLYLADAKLSNASLFRLRGNDVGVAVGAEVRRETYLDHRDPRVNGTVNYTSTSGVVTSDVLGTSPTLNTIGSRNVVSAYAELALPLVTREDDIPLVQSLDLQLAARFEHFYDIGQGVLKPKISAGWQVTDWLKLRGTYSQGFRAPNLEVVNSALISRVQQNLTDYFLCARAQGVTTIAAINKSACGNFRFDVLDNRSGNRGLKPETVDSISGGIVLTPLPRLTLTADYWHIKQKGLIGVFSAADQLNLDSILRLQEGSSNPFLTRDASGRPLSITNQFLNLNSRTVEGVDIGLDYTAARGPLGTFNIAGNVAYLKRFFVAPSEQSALLLANGLPASAGGSLLAIDDNPRFRASGSINWTLGNVSASLFGYYVGPIKLSNALFYPVDDWFTANASVSYRFADGALDGTILRLGVNNIADKDPPLTNNTFGFNPSLANSRGRFIYGQITFRLN